ncbi:MAG TPA: hypothetical protein VFN61_05555 [Acidimicrobiales bacterium]|nr:hypothetical protein [Acidimicrobiales bacterium]
MTGTDEVPTGAPEPQPDLRRHRTRVVVFSMLLAWLVLMVVVVVLAG